MAIYEYIYFHVKILLGGNFNTEDETTVTNIYTTMK